jgi:hypothetical protein
VFDLFRNLPEYPTSGSNEDQLNFVAAKLNEVKLFPKEVHDLCQWREHHDEYPLCPSRVQWTWTGSCDCERTAAPPRVAARRARAPCGNPLAPRAFGCGEKVGRGGEAYRTRNQSVAAPLEEVAAVVERPDEN